MNYGRTKYCGEFRETDVGKSAVVCGWVQKRRDLGGLLFLTLRDRTGIIQCVFDKEKNAELFEASQDVRSEYVLRISGTVAHRSEKDINPNMLTGDVEIIASDFSVFSKSEALPFDIDDDIKTNELLRLKYRYLDLRRPKLQSIFALRHKVMQAARRYYSDNGFYEIETPILTCPTPEGSRDYLVPARLHPGKFYALPQSPQQYKQMLMVAGYDRYFQIARCMRDEDLRADRQPDFTQIDVEMSFAEMDDVLSINEGMMASVFKEGIGYDIKLPLQRMTWHDAMERYGCDKPDTRFGFELKNISDIVENCGFKVFSGAVKAGGSVRLININGYADKFSRKEIDALAEYAKGINAKGLAWLKKIGSEMTSSFAKFLSDEELAKIYERAGVADNDLLLVIADEKDLLVKSVLSALRLECAKKLNLLDSNVYNFLWITEFPLFEWSDEENRYVACHHPFTMPMVEDLHLLEKGNLADCRAIAYDMVCNGYELSSGSIRIHDSSVQSKMFEYLGFSDEEMERRFGHMLTAFKYGVPPHGGIGFGLDRIIMLMAKSDNIRDVVAFPKTQSAVEIMTNSPVGVEEKQLKELSIALDLPEKV